MYYEHTGGYSLYKSTIVGDANGYLGSNPGWAMYVPDWAINTPPIGTLFNFAITYEKGAGVLHMLRYVLQDTNVFFNCIRNYVADTTNFKYKNAVTDDFTASISTTAGQDLSWFINEWVKQPNHPVYQNLYQITTNGGSNWTVGFEAVQTQTNSAFHIMPIVLRVLFASGPDTNIRVLNNVNNQTWYFNFNRQPTNVAFDPDNDIVLKVASTSPGIVGVISNSGNVPKSYALHQNYPNPFNPVTRINFDIPKASFVTMKVYDVLGQFVSEPVNQMLQAGTFTYDFDGSNLPSGVYYYKITGRASTSSTDNFVSTKKMILVK